MVRGLLEAAYSVATDTETSFNELWPVVQKTIGSIVTALNSTVAFKK
jgi:hypothetical protein